MSFDINKTISKAKEIHNFINSGMSATKAAKQVGLGYSTYLYWKNRGFEKSTRYKVGNEGGLPIKKVSFTTLPETKRTYKKRGERTGKLALIIGSPEDVKGFLNEYL